MHPVDSHKVSLLHNPLVASSCVARLSPLNDLCHVICPVCVVWCMAHRKSDSLCMIGSPFIVCIFPTVSLVVARSQTLLGLRPREDKTCCREDDCLLHGVFLILSIWPEYPSSYIHISKQSCWHSKDITFIFF